MNIWMKYGTELHSTNVTGKKKYMYTSLGAHLRLCLCVVLEMHFALSTAHHLTIKFTFTLVGFWNFGFKIGKNIPSIFNKRYFISSIECVTFQGCLELNLHPVHHQLNSKNFFQFIFKWLLTPNNISIFFFLFVEEAVWTYSSKPLYFF